jgi:AraC family transcriptional regulator
LNYLHHVQRGIEFVEAHLGDEIALDAVARHARVSPWHFQRIFKALTGDTLKSYIRARRLAQALDALREPRARVLPIALAAGFESQAAFTRAFKQAFDTTPAKYRADQQRFKHVRKLRIDSAYIEHMHGRVSIEPELRKLRATRFVGMQTRFFGVDSDKCNLGAKLPALWNAFLPRMASIAHRDPRLGYGITIPSDQNEMLTYVAGVALVGPPQRVPTGMVELTVPAATYAVFEHRGHPGDLQRTVNYIYASWLLRSGKRHTYGPDLEFYGDDYLPGSERSVIRYGIPVRGR